MEPRKKLDLFDFPKTDRKNLLVYRACWYINKHPGTHQQSVLNDACDFVHMSTVQNAWLIASGSSEVPSGILWDRKSVLNEKTRRYRLHCYPNDNTKIIADEYFKFLNDLNFEMALKVEKRVSNLRPGDLVIWNGEEYTGQYKYSKVKNTAKVATFMGYYIDGCVANSLVEHCQLYREYRFWDYTTSFQIFCETLKIVNGSNVIKKFSTRKLKNS